MLTIQDLIYVSKAAGQRLDWIQAGGGNTSIKCGETMLVKASGLSLSEMTVDGYVKVKYEEVVSFLRDPKLKTLSKSEQDAAGKYCLKSAVLSSGTPSIETYLHACLGPVVLHIHPWVVTALACRTDWLAQIDQAMQIPSVKVPYRTPGVPLGIELLKQCDIFQDYYKKTPQCIILQNHGLIVSGNTVGEVLTLTEDVTNILADFLNIDTALYRATIKIQQLWQQVTDTLVTVYGMEHPVIQDAILQFPERLKAPVLFPDQVVFGGFGCVDLVSLGNPRPILEYKDSYGVWPRVLRYKQGLYAVASTLKKARETEDVLVCHLMTAALAGTGQTPLKSEELHYLVHWEAEKLRQNI